MSRYSVKRGGVHKGYDLRPIISVMELGGIFLGPAGFVLNSFHEFFNGSNSFDDV